VHQGHIPNQLTYSQIFLKSAHPQQLTEQIKHYAEQTSMKMTVWNVAENKAEERQMVNLVSLFLYGFVVLIMLVCVAGIINTISTTIALRKREFAMLRSIGMTTASFNRMINYESIFYGLQALLYGLPMSGGMMVLIYKLTDSQLELYEVVPWGSIGATMVGVFLLVGSTMLYLIFIVKDEVTRR
jgi:putative ABC transport system permease protein